MCFQVFSPAEPQPVEQPPQPVSSGHLWHSHADGGQPELQLPGLHPMFRGSDDKVSYKQKALKAMRTISWPVSDSCPLVDAPAAAISGWQETSAHFHHSILPVWVSEVYIVKCGRYLATSKWHNNHSGVLCWFQHASEQQQGSMCRSRVVVSTFLWLACLKADHLFSV